MAISRRKKGRPQKLTEVLTLQVETALKNHCTIEDACTIGGITSRTYRTWIAKGKAGEKKYEDFFERCRRAQANARASLMAKLAGGTNIKGDEDWKAIDRVISRLHPELSTAEVSQRALDMKVQELLTEMEHHLSGKERAAMYDAYAKVRGISD